MRHFLLILLLLFFNALHAQQGVVSAGGDITGSGGSMSFSTGLTDFYYLESASGSLSFGLQHAFFYEDDRIPEENHLKDLTVGDGTSNCFAALLTITTAGDGTTFIVESGGQANLIAGQNIILREGTRVEHGGLLHARITTDGTFCPEPDKHFLVTSQLAESNTILPIVNKDTLSVLQEDLFSVFPNPTTGRFTLELSLTKQTQRTFVEVYGMRGERVLREEIQPGQQQHSLNIESHLPGIYIVRVVGGDQYGVQRIIKQ